MGINYGSKRLVVGAHYGFKDWLSQRVTGVLMALFTIVVLALIWAYLHHFIAGVRHLWMDATHSVSKQQGRISAIVTLAASGVLTVLLGAKLFGLY